MAIQDGCAADHCSWLISPPARYANDGYWIGFGNGLRSQMSACLSSPAVVMWHAECGAHASELIVAP